MKNNEQYVFIVMVSWFDFEDDANNYSEILGVYTKRCSANKRLLEQVFEELNDCEMHIKGDANGLNYAGLIDFIKQFDSVGLEQNCGNGKTDIRIVRQPVQI